MFIGNGTALLNEVDSYGPTPPTSCNANIDSQAVETDDYSYFETCSILDDLQLPNLEIANREIEEFFTGSDSNGSGPAPILSANIPRPLSKIDVAPTASRTSKANYTAHTHVPAGSSAQKIVDQSFVVPKAPTFPANVTEPSVYFNSASKLCWDDRDFFDGPLASPSFRRISELCLQRRRGLCSTCGHSQSSTSSPHVCLPERSSQVSSEVDEAALRNVHIALNHMTMPPGRSTSSVSRVPSPHQAARLQKELTKINPISSQEALEPTNRALNAVNLEIEIKEPDPNSTQSSSATANEVISSNTSTELDKLELEDEVTLVKSPLPYGTIRAKSPSDAEKKTSLFDLAPIRSGLSLCNTDNEARGSTPSNQIAKPVKQDSFPDEQILDTQGSRSRTSSQTASSLNDPVPSTPATPTPPSQVKGSAENNNEVAGLKAQTLPLMSTTSGTSLPVARTLSPREPPIEKSVHNEVIQPPKPAGGSSAKGSSVKGSTPKAAPLQRVETSQISELDPPAAAAPLAGRNGLLTLTVSSSQSHEDTGKGNTGRKSQSPRRVSSPSLDCKNRKPGTKSENEANLMLLGSNPSAITTRTPGSNGYKLKDGQKKADRSSPEKAKVVKQQKRRRTSSSVSTLARSPPVTRRAAKKPRRSLRVSGVGIQIK